MKTTIELAREAGFTEGELAFMGDNFLKFAELVRAAERESLATEAERNGNTILAMQIRARGSNT